PISQPDGTRRGRLADPPGQLTVGNRLAVRYLLQASPHSALETGPLEAERQVKAGQVASEVGAELAGGGAEYWVVVDADPLAERPFARLVPGHVHVQAGQLPVLGHQRQRADRTVYHGVRPKRSVCTHTHCSSFPVLINLALGLRQCLASRGSSGRHSVDGVI